MPTPMASSGPLVHPHQLEVQDFDAYALVIDARGRQAFDEDHLPGAVHLPPIEASTNSSSTPSFQDALRPHVARLGPHDLVLIYCDRGGLDSQVWAEALRDQVPGLTVDVLGGGWSNYRRWVMAGLEALARGLSFKRVVGPPLGGASCLLDTLMAQGQQVLDLAAMAGQRSVPGIPWPTDRQMSQSAFETDLVDVLRRKDPARPVWVGDCVLSLGGVQLPVPLVDAFRGAKGVLISAPLEARVSALLTSSRVGERLLDDLNSLVPRPSDDLVARCRTLHATQARMNALAALIEQHLDPLHAPFGAVAPVGTVALPSLSDESLQEAVAQCLSLVAVAVAPGH